MVLSMGVAKDKLLGAASRRFYAEGIAATGIDSITAEAGVAKMSLYNNFSSGESCRRLRCLPFSIIRAS